MKKLHPNLVAFPLPGGNHKLAAGWLIEQCGWKGYCSGDAGCYGSKRWCREITTLLRAQKYII